MSVEDRLRDGLADNATRFTVDVDSALERVTTRARRPFRRRLAGAVAGVVAVAAAVVLLVTVQRPSDEVRTTQEPTASTVPSGPPVQTLTGRFTTQVAGGTVGLPYDVSGQWVIEFHADGTMLVRAPASYTGVVSAPLFEATGESFRTSLFETDLCSGNPVGSYRWRRSGSSVRFTVVDDSCAGRVTVLTSQPWTELP
jgi:hypothetical protein